MLTEDTGREIRQLGVRVSAALRRGQRSTGHRTKHAAHDNACHEASSNARATLHHCVPGCRATMPTGPTTVNLACREVALPALLPTPSPSCKDSAAEERADAHTKKDRNQATHDPGFLPFAGEHASPTARRAEPDEPDAETGHQSDHTRSTSRLGTTAASSATAADGSRETRTTRVAGRRNADRTIPRDTGDRSVETAQANPAPTERALSRRGSHFVSPHRGVGASHEGTPEGDCQTHTAPRAAGDSGNLGRQIAARGRTQPAGQRTGLLTPTRTTTRGPREEATASPARNRP